MLIERFITSYVRKKNAEYMRFAPSEDLSIPERRAGVPLMLYVHVPFCEQLCPYCSFNRVVFEAGVARSYFKALRREMEMYRELGYDFHALYVGGGTPTVLVDELAETLGLARKIFSIGEVSVETNPNHLTDANVAILREAGVQRLSVGVQSFDNDLLKTIERHHKYGSGEEIQERLSRILGLFQTVNVDMIFNFPTQTMVVLEQDLATINKLGVDQVTYYPLMVSDFTASAMRRKLGEVDYNRGQAFYTKIVEMLDDAFESSTAWCFSRKQGMIDEYVVNFDEYAGLGSGSIGYLGGAVYANTFDIGEYVRRIGAGRLPVMARKECSLDERLRYDFLMKLFGLKLDLAEMDRRYGVKTGRHLWPDMLFFRLVGGLTRQGDLLRLTPRGQYFWVLMMREFFVAVNNFRDYCRA
jgi:menaquinone C8-methyltransferase